MSGHVLREAMWCEKHQRTFARGPDGCPDCRQEYSAAVRNEALEEAATIVELHSSVYMTQQELACVSQSDVAVAIRALITWRPA